ncbi:MAG: methyltransferase domain-containing protein [Hydrogenophilaceae bacterium]|nr:methyltransferase domain-containing protein [Hydrogenophilaceae bacterium]
MSLKHSYTLFAPIYDALIASPSAQLRARSLAALAELPSAEVLIPGIGTGLDLPHLPPQHRYTGLDLTPAMLERALPRATDLDIRFIQGDSQRLPFADTGFDHVMLHLILAVVPDPRACLAEAVRVVRPGGSILILDKFLKPGEAAPMRRLLNPITRRLATRLDVVFEDLIAHHADIELISDQPALLSGWFRLIQLRKAD